MIPSIRSLACAAALLALGTLPAAAQRPAPTAPPQPRPTLIVLFTIDQMRADYFDRFAPQLTGGLARLRRGAFFSNAFQDHAVTETAPGHATTLSGRFPRSTGIVTNTQGVNDAQAPLVGGGGYGASPFRFRGTTLTDWLRTRDPRSRALSVSRKDRGAILPLGRAHQQVFWYAADGRFTTSTYYADTLPSWVQRFNARRVPQSMAGRAWTTLLAPAQYSEPDSVSVENGMPFDPAHRDVALPHAVPADPALAARAFPEFPWMDSLTLDLAWTGLRALQLGEGPQTDVLAVSLSTTDAVGHRYGQDSRELHDQILRLDRALGAFMDSLYAVRDSSRIVIALTSDHGVTSFPEVRVPGAAAAAYHVETESAVAAVRQPLLAAGLDSTAFSFDDGLLFVNRTEFARAGLDADAAVNTLAAALRAAPGVARADRIGDLRARADSLDALSRRWVHMIPDDVPVELVVTLLPGRVWGHRPYAQHGAPTDDDAHVPLLFYGAGIQPGTYNGFVRVVDLAPTLARLAGVPPTEPLDGRVLSQALR